MPPPLVTFAGFLEMERRPHGRAFSQSQSRNHTRFLGLYLVICARAVWVVREGLPPSFFFPFGLGPSPWTYFFVGWWAAFHLRFPLLEEAKFLNRAFFGFSLGGATHFPRQQKLYLLPASKEMRPPRDIPYSAKALLSQPFSIPLALLSFPALRRDMNRPFLSAVPSPPLAPPPFI